MLRSSGFEVHKNYFPWKYEKDLWDPLTGNCTGHLVKWDDPKK